MILERPGARMQDRGRLWAIVLAGGEGQRLRPLTRLICGDDRPKQYAALLGARSLLRETLERVALVIPPERTVVVTHRRHARWMAAEADSARALTILPQPEDRGTAAGVLFPAQWIHAHDPDARLVVFPSDHFILDPHLFMRHVAAVDGFVSTHPDRLVLLGARPARPEVEYGWIEPAAPIGRIGGEPVCAVRRFIEKPAESVAQTCFAVGCLWNTFVLATSGATLLAEGRRALPELGDRLAHITPFVGTEDEAWAVHQAYALAPTANFSKAILERCPPCLAVARLPPLVWSDWGTPARVLQSLRTAGISPPWYREIAAVSGDHHGGLMTGPTFENALTRAMPATRRNHA